MKQSLIDSIKNYSDKIKTLPFKDAVREMPGEYIGHTGNEGFKNMYREIYQNAADQIIRAARGESPCTHIIITYDEREGINQVIIEDDGQGIPFNKMKNMFTIPHTSSNFEKKLGEYSSGRHGEGSKATNALSIVFTVESYVLGEGRRITFTKDIPWEDSQIEVIKNPEKKQGTIVSFKPDYEIMGEITCTVTEILAYTKFLIPLLNIGATIYFNGIRKDGTVYQEKLVNEDGIISYLIMETTSPLVNPIIMSDDIGKMKADIAFTWDSNDLQVEHIISFSNFCPTVSGTHVEGFLEGVCKFFREYMNKIYLAGSKNKKLSIVTNDVKTGLKAIIAVSHLKPNFTGQAKESLDNKDMFYYVRDLVLKSLENWSKNNASDLQTVCKYLKDVADARLKADSEKIKITTKYNASSLTGLPKKYTAPIGREHLEFIIVEGDSAKNGYVNVRDKKKQGIFPIRGKLPNAFAKTKQEFFNNEEIQGIVKIQGTGHLGKCIVEDCKYEKIIFTPDADPDGSHIRVLLLSAYLMYWKELIEAGRVFAAVPPLFGMPIGNGKKKRMKYFTEIEDKVKFVQDLFSKNNTVSSLRGRQLTENEIIKMCIEFEEYTYDIDRISYTYALTPNLLELILANRNLPVEELFKVVKERYRFLNIKSSGTLYTIEGLIEDGENKINTVFLTDRFFHDIDKLNDKYDLLHKPIRFNVNGELKSLYDFMIIFQAAAPANLIRYKGLGEMNADQLAESTLHPDSDRTLIQYTIESAQKEIEMITYLESNKFEFIKDAHMNLNDIMNS